MSGDIENKSSLEEDTVDIDEDAVVDVDNDDNVGDLSVEINVDELVAKLEASENDDMSRKREVRKRLEEAREAEDSLESTYNFNLDDDL